MDSKNNSEIQELTSKEHKPFSSIPRFAIMLILYGNETVRIKDLTGILNLTIGNLDHHLRILEKEELVKKNLKIFPKRLYSSVIITEKGKISFERYTKTLKHLLE
jgi:DNA-binding MarR family transcriptional regulator